MIDFWSTSVHCFMLLYLWKIFSSANTEIEQNHWSSYIASDAPKTEYLIFFFFLVTEIHTHHGCPCVGISLESLNCVHKKLEFNLKAVIKEHAEHSAAVARLNAKLSHLLKEMKQSRIFSTLKAHCVASKLDDDNDETENETPSIVSQPNNAVLWSFLDFLLSSPQNIEASLHSSWGFAWVLKLILRYHILFTWQDSELPH